MVKICLGNKSIPLHVFHCACHGTPSKVQCNNHEKKSTLLLAVKSHQNIFSPGTCFAYAIPEPELMVCSQLKNVISVHEFDKGEVEALM